MLIYHLPSPTWSLYRVDKTASNTQIIVKEKWQLPFSIYRYMYECMYVYLCMGVYMRVLILCSVALAIENSNKEKNDSMGEIRTVLGKNL